MIAIISRSRIALSTVAVAAAILLTGCGERDVTAPGRDVVTEVRVDREAATLELINKGDEPLAYMVLDADYAEMALILLAFCNDPGPACRRLPAHGSVTVPYAGIMGHETSGDAVLIHFWRVLPDGEGSYKVGGLASERVEL